MPPRPAPTLAALLAARTHKAWDKICAHLDAIPDGPELALALHAVGAAVRHWPVTVHRPPLATWHGTNPRLKVCRNVRETSLYTTYIAAICALCTCDPARPCSYQPRPTKCLRCTMGGPDVKGLPDLRTRDNRPACALERQYVGQAMSADGAHTMDIGEAGSADIKGGMILEWSGRNGKLCSVEWRTEVEIKMEDGRARDGQIVRQAAFDLRTGLYIFARTLPQAIQLLYDSKQRKQLEFSEG